MSDNSELEESSTHTQKSGFYDIYSQIRVDLLAEFETAIGDKFSRHELVQGAQRLLDRMLFIHYCEDHPDRLLPASLSKDVCQAAKQMPGGSTTKIYDALKQLFRDIDQGVYIPKYNGELFKPHPLVDEVSISDDLAHRLYHSSKNGGLVVQGPWGLHVFDFWTDLSPALLGNIFERSLGDLQVLEESDTSLAEQLEPQKKWGVYYTSELLAQFLTNSALDSLLSEHAVFREAMELVAEANDLKASASAAETMLEALKSIKIADLSCGSGAFLNAALTALLKPYKMALKQTLGTIELSVWAARSRQAELLKASIFGVDLLEQAVELAKLSLWLGAVRKDETTTDLSDNVVVGDSLQHDIWGKSLAFAPDGLDLVVGNPPWGGTYESKAAKGLMEEVGFETSRKIDSWELFILLAYRVLKPNGILGLVLPDTLHSSDKQETLKFLLKHFEIEKLYNLGPDWFGPQVRMGTIIIQARKKEFEEDHMISAMLLSGKQRKRAQEGTETLRMIEGELTQEVSQARCMEATPCEINVFRSEYDYRLLETIQDSSVSLKSISERGRGEEMNAAGLMWECPNCGGYTVPGRKQKGGTYASKECPFCELELGSDTSIQERLLVSKFSRGKEDAPYLDGKLLTKRYQTPQNKWIDTTERRMEPALKSAEVFKSPKILIRQAGVGMTATVDYLDARCPQSVYIYRVNDKARTEGYSEEFILGVLVSRVTNYYLLKRFAEVDPARAHVKLTHSRLADFPIPKLDTPQRRDQADEIASLVKDMMQPKPNLGGSTDLHIEFLVRKLFGLDNTAGAYINGVFSLVPQSQAIDALFPDGPPDFIRPTELN